MHYLDHAATTPVPRAVAEEMARVLTEDFGNPSSQYALGRAARDLVDRSRQTIANALGCEAKQLYFTSCGTEADNWALRAALHRTAGRDATSSLPPWSTARCSSASRPWSRRGMPSPI